MSAGSKINNLSARLQSQQFAISGDAFRSARLFSAAAVASCGRTGEMRRKYPKEIAGSSLAELKAVASAIFMIATQVRCLAAHSLGPGGFSVRLSTRSPPAPLGRRRRPQPKKELLS
jgi:hypothetical protein